MMTTKYLAASLCATLALLGAGTASAAYADGDRTSITQRFEHMTVSVSDGAPGDDLDPFLSVAPDSILGFISTFEWMGGNTDFYAQVGPGTRIDLSFDLITHAILDKRYVSLIDIEAGGYCIMGGFCNESAIQEYFGGRFVISSDGAREGVIEKMFIEHVDFEIFNWHDDTRTLHLSNGGGGVIHYAWPPYEPPPVPEPESYALLLVGLVSLALQRSSSSRGRSPVRISR